MSPSVQFLLISRSFQQKSCQIIGFCPELGGWRPLPMLDLPLLTATGDSIHLPVTSVLQTVFNIVVCRCGFGVHCLPGSGDAPANQPVLELPVFFHASHTRTGQSGERAFKRGFSLKKKNVVQKDLTLKNRF